MAVTQFKRNNVTSDIHDRRLPSTLGTAGQVLAVNSGANAIVWADQTGGGNVDDVKVNGTSVVDANKIAQVTVPTKTSDITNDSGFITNSYHDSTKQDTISDLTTIRSGAALGATSSQPGDNVSTFTNDAGYLTLATLPRYNGEVE